MHGLPNLGNTCYLNSVLQLFVSLKLLVYPQDLRQFINSLDFPNIYTQNDPHEFMMFMLDKLQNVASTKILIKDISPNIYRPASKIWKKANENLYQYGYNISGNMKSNAIYLSHASKFIGQRIYRKKCNNIACANVRVSFDTFSTLEIPLQCSGQNTLQSYLSEEYLTETQCTVTCKKCGCTTATNTVHIWKKPKLLALVLGRNADAQTKNNVYVDIPQSLDISKYSIFAQKRNYLLHGFLSHHGRSFNNGHCSYSYLHEGSWYTFDDNSITNAVNYGDAYIIIYK